MTPTAHVIYSGVTCSLFGLLVRSWSGAIACFLGGILIDFDHLLDYCLHYKRMCWRLSDLANYCYDVRESKTYLIFHSYELVVVLWILTLYFQLGFIWMSFLFGMSVHLLLDQLINDIHPMAYFWFYRRRYGFTKKVFHSQDFRREFKK